MQHSNENQDIKQKLSVCQQYYALISHLPLCNQLHQCYSLYYEAIKRASSQSKIYLISKRIIMFAASNPSYYRAHQYLHQLDLPNSAFKNRDIQLSPLSIPQGKEYFQPSSKKHFAHKFNRSQIEDNNVMLQYPEEQVKNSRLVFQPTYFRSLNVGDIEGTQPNTLISKAVRNRQKAEMLMKKQQNVQSKPLLFGNESHLVRQRKMHQYNPSQDSYSQEKPFLSKQAQAENRFKKSKSILQNSSFNILRNFNSNQDNHNDHQSQRTNVKTLGDHDISVEKLTNIGVDNFHFKGQTRGMNINLQKSYGGLKSEESERGQVERKVPNLRQERVYEIENHLVADIHAKDHDRDHRNDDFAKNINSERERTYQNNQNQNFRLPSRRSDPHQSSSRVDDYSWEPQKASRMHTEAQNPLTSLSKVSNTFQIDKSNIRMFNPTFLSYQSQAIAKNNK